MSDAHRDDLAFVPIREMNQEEITAFVNANIVALGEEDAVAVLVNRFCTPQICLLISQTSRLMSYYEVKNRLVSCRATPQHVAMKFMRHLYWTDLLRHSVDVRVPPGVRRAIDNQLVGALQKLTLGERISMAKTCSRELIKVLVRDPDSRVFTGLLNNGRLREEDLVEFVRAERVPAQHLRLIGDHFKWGSRYAIRRALAFNPQTPRAIAATQLRFLTREDRALLMKDPATSVYLRRCLESFGRDSSGASNDSEPGAGGIGYND